MSDMRPVCLRQAGARDHNVLILSVRVAHLSPSSSGAGVQESLLEGDCVGLTWPIPPAGLFWARLFFCFVFAASSHPQVDSIAGAQHGAGMFTRSTRKLSSKKAPLAGRCGRVR